MTKCKWCNEDLALDCVQQGGMHLSCAENEITVLKYRPAKGYDWICTTNRAELESYIASMDTDDNTTLEIQCVKMSIVKYDSLRESKGW